MLIIFYKIFTIKEIVFGVNAYPFAVFYKIEEVKSGGIAHNAGHRAERTCTWVFSLETPPKEKAPEQAPKVKAPEQTPKVKAALTRPRPKGKSSSRTTRTNEG